MSGFKIISQYERGIVFRFGRALPGERKPGLIWVNPFTCRLRKVNMQIVVAAVPGQETITRDNVTLRVDAVVYYRVVDPLKAIVNVQNYQFAVSQVAQTSLRPVIGRSNMDQLLSEREHVNAELKDVIDAPTEQPWGIRVERVEVKDVSLPESMKRSMSRQAEAERERRARIISADGEFQAARKLAQAATVMAADPAALQLRLLQTVAEVAAEKNSTLIMPLPVELLRFFDHAAPAVPQTGHTGHQPAPPTAHTRHHRPNPHWPSPRWRRPHGATYTDSLTELLSTPSSHQDRHARHSTNHSTITRRSAVSAITQCSNVRSADLSGSACAERRDRSTYITNRVVMPRARGLARALPIPCGAGVERLRIVNCSEPPVLCLLREK